MTLANVILIAALIASCAYAGPPGGSGAGAPAATEAVDGWKIAESIGTVLAALAAVISAGMAKRAQSSADQTQKASATLLTATNASLAAAAQHLQDSAATAHQALEEAMSSDKQTIAVLKDQLAQQGKSNEQSIRMFRGQAIFQLYSAWENVAETPHETDPKALDVVRGIRALSITATVWLAKLIDHDVLYDDYWKNYRMMFDSIIKLKPIIGDDKTLIMDPPNELGRSIRKAYGEMQTYGMNEVKRTEID